MGPWRLSDALKAPNADEDKPCRDRTEVIPKKCVAP
jgi:hypothetical protein